MDDGVSTPATQTPLIALMWRGDPALPPDPRAVRQWPIFEALEARGMRTMAVAYDDGVAAAIEARLAGCDGVLVWVDPISPQGDRSVLDPMLRRLAAAGVWVSAHPDIAWAMGVKEVLYRTRTLGWGTDTERYETRGELVTRFPATLARGPRVLKQNRGNGGIGVWKVTRRGSGSVDVLAIGDDALREGMDLDAFLEECAALIAPGRPMIDQAFEPGVAEGMVRCYLCGPAVIGFAEQSPREPKRPGAPTFAIASPKTMRAAAEPRFAALRESMERDWVPGMTRLLETDERSLPALWDADFLPREGGHVLCEINVSSVAPFPPWAGAPVAERVAAMLAARR